MLTPTVESSSYLLQKKKKLLAATLRHSPQPVSILKKAKKSTTRPRKLSEVLIQDRVQVPENNALSLADMQITEIDRGPQAFQRVTSLDLRKNSLESLGDIKQFARLRKLNLQDNSLSDIKELLSGLGALKYLEEIELEGNPVLRNTFNCKAQVLTACKRLKAYNSSKVTQDDLWNAGVALEKERDLFGTLAAAYKELCAHRSALEKLRLAPQKNASVLLANARQKLVEGFDEEGYKAKLVRKLVERCGQQNEGWEERALSEELLRIEDKIAEAKRGLDISPSVGRALTPSATVTCLRSGRAKSTQATPRTRPKLQSQTVYPANKKKVTIMEDALKAAKRMSITTRNETSGGGLSHTMVRYGSTTATERPEMQTAEKTNQILKAKLIQFQRQNNANVEKATGEIGKLKEGIKEAEMKNRRLVAELETATKRMQQIMSEGYKTEVEREAKRKEERERRKEFAEKMGNMKVSRRALKDLRNATRLLRTAKDFVRLSRERVKGRTFHLWKRGILILKMIRYWTASRAKLVLHKSLRRLAAYASLSRKYHQFLRFRLFSLAKKTFAGFKRYPSLRLSVAKKRALAQSYHNGKLLKSAILGAKTFISRIYLSPEEERGASILASRFRQLHAKYRAIQHLKGYTIGRRPARQREQAAIECYLKGMCRHVFAGLKARVLERKIGEQKVEYFRLARRKLALRKFVLMLKINVRNRRKNKILRTLGTKVQLKRMLSYWSRAHNKLADAKEREHAVARFSDAKIARKVWQGLVMQKLRREKEGIMSRAVRAKRLHYLAKSFFHKWATTLRMRAFYRQIQSTHKERLIASSLQKWKERHWTKQARKAKTHCADVLAKSSFQRYARSVLRAWISHLRRRRMLSRRADQFRSSLVASSRLSVFSVWLRALKERIKAKSRVLEANISDERLHQAASASLLEKLETECRSSQAELEQVRISRANAADELHSKASVMDAKEAEWRQLKEECLNIEENIKAYDREYTEMELKKESAIAETASIRARQEAMAKSLEEENEVLTRALAKAELEAREQQEGMVRVEQELLQIHRKGGNFRDLEEVAGENQKLMINLESRKQELAELEDTLKKTEESNAVLSAHISQINDSQNLVLTNKDERIEQLAKQNERLHTNVTILKGKLRDSKPIREERVEYHSVKNKELEESTRLEAESGKDLGSDTVRARILKKEISHRLDRLEKELQDMNLERSGHNNQ